MEQGRFILGVLQLALGNELIYISLELQSIITKQLVRELRVLLDHSLIFLGCNDYLPLLISHLFLTSIKPLYSLG